MWVDSVLYRKDGIRSESTHVGYALLREHIHAYEAGRDEGKQGEGSRERS